MRSNERCRDNYSHRIECPQAWSVWHQSRLLFIVRGLIEIKSLSNVTIFSHSSSIAEHWFVSETDLERVSTPFQSNLSPFCLSDHKTRCRRCHYYYYRLERLCALASSLLSCNCTRHYPPLLYSSSSLKQIGLRPAHWLVDLCMYNRWLPRSGRTVSHTTFSMFIHAIPAHRRTDNGREWEQRGTHLSFVEKKRNLSSSHSLVEQEGAKENK